MAYSNRNDWHRDRDRDSQFSRQQQDWDDESRRARESMERDYYGAQERGGYGGGSERMQRGYGQGDYDQQFGQGGGYGSQGGRFSESGYGRGREYSGRESRGHYGNEEGGWQGREREQWRNRSAQGEYDRNANYGGYGSSGTGNYRGYGGGGGSYTGGQREYTGRGEMRNEGGHGLADMDEGYRSYGQGLDWREGSYRQDQESGQHRGRGPRGYRRSDERIREDVCDCLSDDDRLDASNIDVIVKEGEVQLSGSVTSREDKRRAESLVECISGVKEVQNGIRVQDQQRTQTTGQTGAAATGKDKGRDIQH